MSNPQCCGIPKIFNDKKARKSLKSYLKKGPAKESRKLIESLKERDVQGLTLLDVGGGIGAVQLELIANGVTSATDVDASPAYMSIAKEESARRGLQDKISYIEGDFTTEGAQVAPADIVTLDKVICCYNRMEEIVTLSVSKATKYYGLVYPKENALSRVAKGLGNFILWVSGSKFRSYVHPVKDITRLIEAGGFQRVHFDTTFIWRIELYEKVA
jgi:magnesium-protoporphyrin O-methyltransferase